MAVFFYSGVKDLCSARNFTLEAKDNTEDGALCAIVNRGPNVTGGVYACPAGQENCWTAPISCDDSQKQDWQRILTCGGYCCNGFWETCSTDSARPNTCFADPGEAFENPIRNIQPSLAVQIAQSALAASVTGVLASNAVPTALSARIVTTSANNAGSINVIAATASSSITSITAAFAPTSTTSPTPTSGVVATRTISGNLSDSTESAEDTSVPTAVASTSSGSSGLGSGAIAGIAVGVAAMVIILLLIAFLVFRKRKQQRRAAVAMRDQSLEDDELPQEKQQRSNVYEVHNLNTMAAAAPPAISVRSHSVYSVNHEDAIARPKSPGGLSVDARSLGAISAISALSTHAAAPVAPVSPILSPIDMTPSPIETPPSPMATEVKQGPSHLVAQQSPDRPVSPLLALEQHHPSEGESLVPALEPSPLQQVIMHGAYQPR